MKTKRYMVKDAGQQIYTSLSVRPRPFSLRKTAICDRAWDTTAASWGGNMDLARQSLSKVYGSPVTLEENGEVEVLLV